MPPFMGQADLMDLSRWLPPEGVNGGIRTFPLIGLKGYALACLSGGDVAGGDVTSEMSGLAICLLGVLVSHEIGAARAWPASVGPILSHCEGWSRKSYRYETRTSLAITAWPNDSPPSFAGTR